MRVRSSCSGALALLKAKGKTATETERCSASGFTFAFFLLPCCFCLLLGCSSSGPKPVKVKGTVTLDGKPIDGAGVTFLSTGQGGRQATGITGPDGSFQLTTFTPNDGALPGEYKVTIVYGEQISASDVPKAEQGKTMKDMWDASQKAMKATAKKPPKYVIPEKYSDPGKTVLKQRVPAEGPVKLDLEGK